ncbi:streptogrisin B precursor [Streptomyces verrucosisporus]|uniref:S1 family peptidase n=1 Tax=Streptomyces verrucosisporus TaxID=1695161 RepID=UPI0019D0E755|nr:S1 family peptidase [Streptomyces verrucosisporus]MBN3928443.1 streptogrisin B precursor [Streptomyces verrucosisporus]
MRRPPAPATVLALLAALATVLLGAPAASAASTTSASAAPIAVRGGDVLYDSQGHRCMVAFNARRGTAYYGLAAGHCMGSEPTTWYADAARTVPVGTTAARSFPGNDYGIIRYTNTTLSYPGEVSLGGGAVRDITGAASPRVGQSVCHVGRATGLRCGTVTAVNVTVNYPGGIVYGLFRSNACSEPGDTAGPAFSGTTALGVIVGGSGNCVYGGATYYQPVTEILAAYGLSLY